MSGRYGEGLKCPECQSNNLLVNDSRPAAGYHRRRYKCECGHRFTTVEFTVFGNAMTPEDLFERINFRERFFSGLTPAQRQFVNRLILELSGRSE
jgi:transcriptional regulator NrdR family protein